MTNPKFTKRDKLDVARDICAIVLIHVIALLFSMAFRLIDYGRVDALVIRVIAIQLSIAGLLILAIWALTKIINKGDKHE